ncbi:MAG: hypothetical protein OEV94_03620 [Deltaproteobacteria bacterium]|nr:hypothetical protein [Deltaproteobacteria bacterium]
MTGDLNWALLGLLFGLLHSFDADHLAAVGMMASDTRRPWDALRVGWAWALGHFFSVAALGLGVVSLGIGLTPWLQSGLETTAGVFLLGMGLWRLAGLRKSPGDSRGSSPATGALSPQIPSYAPVIPWGKTVGMGLLHGLAGTAGVLALAPALAISSAVMYVAYLGLFGLGTALSMGLFALTSRSAQAPTERWSTGERWNARLKGTWGLVSVVVGIRFVAMGLGA